MEEKHLSRTRREKYNRCGGMFPQRKLNKKTAHDWLKNEYQLDAVVRKLERPRVGPEGETMLATFADEFADVWVEEDNAKFVD
eukprot:3086313-Amphidinium_carterae.1